jgi:predicted LPLAT superfamily acyltransferase
MNEPHGCVIISAHVGNWELSCRFLTSYKIGAFNMVMLNAEDPAIAEQVRASLGTHRVNVIDLADPMSASLLIISALNQGETCCMLSDRTAGANDHTIRVPFLGGLARFPTGPFLAAGLTGAMILPAFCLKTSWRSYATVAMPPVRLRFTSRQARNRELAAAVSDWARVLEGVVRRYPLQWHNFYDFWEA